MNHDVDASEAGVHDTSNPIQWAKECRKRCKNSIMNTGVGAWLGTALSIIETNCNRAISTNLLEIAMEQRDPAKWAAMMIVKGGHDGMTVGDAMDMIEGTLRHALKLMLETEQRTNRDSKSRSG